MAVKHHELLSLLRYSLSKLSTTIAPIEAGIEITITLLIDTTGSVNKGSLSKQVNTNATTMAGTT